MALGGGPRRSEGEALRSPLVLWEHEARGTTVCGPAGDHGLRDGPRGCRSAAGKQHAAQKPQAHAKQGYCQAWNDHRGCAAKQKLFPFGQLHRCDFATKNGPCGAWNHNRFHCPHKAGGRQHASEMGDKGDKGGKGAGGGRGKGDGKGKAHAQQGQNGGYNWCQNHQYGNGYGTWQQGQHSPGDDPQAGEEARPCRTGDITASQSLPRASGIG